MLFKIMFVVVAALIAFLSAQPLGASDATIVQSTNTDLIEGKTIWNCFFKLHFK